MSQFEIRRLKETDIKRVVAVWQRARWDSQPWLERRMSYSHQQNLTHFREVVVPTNDIWVAHQRTSTIGFLAIREGHIDHLYVDPLHQSIGVGTALLRKARELSPAKLTLVTHVRNQEARAFYRSRGFHATRFGISPAPESEPDVRYEWTPSTWRQVN